MPLQVIAKANVLNLYGGKPFTVYGTITQCDAVRCFVLWDTVHKWFISAPIDDFKPYTDPRESIGYHAIPKKLADPWDEDGE